MKWLILVKRNFVQIALAAIILFSFAWLIAMAFVLGAKNTDIKLEYRVYLENADYTPIRNPQVTITEGLQHEDALFRVLADAEEHLRNQLTTWLTILGFFGIVFGLLVPLINYMLQRQTLADERKRMTKEINDKLKISVSSLDGLVKDAVRKAEDAICTASRVEKNMSAFEALAKPEEKTSTKASEMPSAVVGANPSGKASSIKSNGSAVQIYQSEANS